MEVQGRRAPAGWSGRTLRGVSHVHSTYSFDGRLPLAELREFLVDRRLNFVLMSEHVETLSVASVRAFVRECRALSTNTFVVVPGLEIETLNLLVFGITGMEPYSGLQGLVDQLRAQHALFVLSHPAKLHAGALPAVADLIDGVEVWNRKYDGRRAPRARSLALYRALRGTNSRLVASCGLDFHGPADYADIWLEVAAGELSQEAVLRAVKHGAFRICRNGRPIPIYDAEPWLRRAAFSATSLCSTGTYDFASRASRWLAGAGVEAPAALKRLLKRLL